MQDKYYTVKELATLWKVHTRTVNNWIKDGQLKAVKLGQQWRISQKSVDEFIGK